RPPWSTDTACTARAPRRRRSGCTRVACRSRRTWKAKTRWSHASHAIERGHLIERAAESPLGRGALVTDGGEHQSVIQHAQVVDRVDHPTHLVVGLLEEAGVDLHLPDQHRLEVIGACPPRPGSRGTGLSY